MAREDAFSRFESLLSGPPSDPWAHVRGDAPDFRPDHELLGRLLSIPVAAGAAQESGTFANGIDLWTARELCRSGFAADEVWPRSTRPRILARDLAVLLERLPAREREQLAARILTTPAVAPTSARVLGRAYEKQVDVLIARWDRGPELMISTKAQLSSFAKNLPNRFEEAYGDAGNLTGRYPLAAVGFLFVQRATILEREPDAFERTVDMIRKLRDRGDGNGYTATGLLLVGWTDDGVVTARPDLVPPDVAPAQFFTRMIRHVLDATPVTFHVRVRELLERRTLPVAPAD